MVPPLDKEKSKDEGARTVRLKGVVCDKDPEVPVIVTGYVPVGVDVEAETVKLDVQLGIHDPEEKSPVAPDGRPETEKETDWAVPEATKALTV